MNTEKNNEMDEVSDVKTSGSPVYLSLAKLEKLLETISTTKSKSITATTLKPVFGTTDASIAVGALKFLKLIDSTGAPTEDIKKFYIQGDERTSSIQPVIQNAYSDLFEAVVDHAPQNLSAEKLRNLFVNVYKVTPRIADPAVRAFYYLCEEVGLKEKTVRAPKPHVVKSPQLKKSGNDHSKASAARPAAVVSTGMTEIPFASGIITLIIPTEILTNAALLPKYTILIDSVNSFSKDYLLLKSDDVETGSKNG